MLRRLRDQTTIRSTPIKYKRWLGVARPNQRDRASRAVDNERSPDPATTAESLGQESRTANWGLWLTFVGVLALLGVFGWAVLQPSAAPEPGEPAPDFEIETFDGSALRLSDLQGRVVVLNFWASWCKPCEDEAAELESLWREYQDRGVLLVGVNYTDTREAALGYLERFDITYPNGPDRGDRVARMYGLAGVPETWVIDQDGRIVAFPVDTGDGLGVAKLVGPVAAGSAFAPEDMRRLLDQLTSGATP
jgi:cytochrome c biogenesis protein CcmG/thiol:disulfide interchange protein DsbE